MSRGRQQFRVELDAGLGAPSEQARSYPEHRSDETPFRIALLGDFSGRSSRGVLETGRALSSRRPVRVDRDSVDEVIARLAPELQLPVGDADAPSTVRFTELDDFHPDRLYERLPQFRALRDARELAAAPAPHAEPGRQSGRASAARSATAGGNVLDQILGDVPLPPGGAAAASPRNEPSRSGRTDPLTDFVQRAVAPHVVSDTGPAHPERVADADARISEELRALLHHADFQALESAWRTVDFLARRLETDATLQIHLVDVSKSELAADLSSLSDIATSGAYRLLADSPAAGESRWTLLVGLFTFGPDPDDVALLAALAAVAKAAGAPLVAGAHPRLVGSPSFGTAPDPDDWTRDETPAWHAVRKGDAARFVGLAAPRFLLRLPYGGRDGEPTEVPAFEELSAPDAHEEYLWGNSAALCGLLYGEAFAAGGWTTRPDLDVRGLPLHLVRVDGDVEAKPCAEAVLSARAVDRIVERGVMAVQSLKDGDAVRLHRLQSIAEPLAPLALRAPPRHAGY